MSMKGTMKLSTLLKLALYVFLAIATAIVAELSGMTLEDLKALDPIEWIVKILTIIVIPPLLTARAFIDQSITTFTDER